MKRRVACFLCFLFLFSFSLSLSSSAANIDIESNEVVFDNADDYFFNIYNDFDPNKTYILTEEGVNLDEYEYGISTIANSGPLYSFDSGVLNQIDLDSIPSDIYNIIHSDNCLIIIRATASKYRIFVLRNGFVYHYLYASSRDKYLSYFGLGTFDYSSTGDSFNVDYANKSCCYTAVYNYDGSISTPWSEYSKSTIPIMEEKHSCIRRYLSATSSTSSYDFYSIGNSNPYKGTTKFSSSTNTSNDGDYLLIAYGSLTSSSVDGMYLSKDEIVFPSYDSQELNTSKSIFSKIGDIFDKLTDIPGLVFDKFKSILNGLSSKISDIFSKLAEIPSLIIDGIKSLFIPSEGFFDTYFHEIDEYFTPKLGMVLEIPSFIIEIFEKLVAFSPNEEYAISIPKIESFYIDENGDQVYYTVIESQIYKFDFLNEGAFGTLYEFYRGFVWCMFIFSLLNLLWRKSNKILGGDTG